VTAAAAIIIYTRDARVPFSDDDREMEHSWRCIPVPPTADDEWIIVDDSKDYKTGWIRRCHLSAWGSA
jgi:hypothetical protein